MSLPLRHSDSPLYQQVKDYIVGRILSGDWAEHARVPSENELTRDLAVSRMTVHRALRELTAEGWLTRMQGAGTFVAEQKPQSALLEIRNIRDEIAERGHRHDCRVIKLEREPAGREVAFALNVPPGGEIYHAILLHLENDVPIQVEDRQVNPAFAPGYIEQDFTATTSYAYLNDLGPLDVAEHNIEAVRPNALCQELLDIPPDEPCLSLVRRTWSNGLVVSRATFLYPGSRYRLAGRQDYGNQDYSTTGAER